MITRSSIDSLVSDVERFFYLLIHSRILFNPSLLKRKNFKTEILIKLKGSYSICKEVYVFTGIIP